MDRFSEQLIKKEATGRDMFIRGLYIAAAMALLAGTAFLLLYFGLAALAIAGAVIWGLVWLLQGTSVEYEYIVTNDDLDIDKIIGRRKRKRLITVSLSKVQELAELKSDGSVNADVTVMAHDETGTDMWYLCADTDKYGRLAVIFNPDRNTLYNMIGGFSPAVRNRYSDLYKAVKPENKDEEQEPEDPAAPEE
ncbi:MAG: DUF6106 family protein [Ruminiclostridium sp.]|nr:DUF6106 family protein [Ruminiclostridium sp.]